MLLQIDVDHGIMQYFLGTFCVDLDRVDLEHLNGDCIIACIVAMIICNRVGSSILYSLIAKHDKARRSMMQLVLSLPLPSRYLHHQGTSVADGSMVHQPTALMQPSTWDMSSGAMLSNPATSVAFEAHSSLETLMMVFSPSQLAVQVWFLYLTLA